MRLTREELIRSGQESALVLFAQGIKADQTREKYTRTLRQVLCKMLAEILEGTFEERAAQLVRYARENPEWTRDLLLSLSLKFRERTALRPDDPEYLNPVSFGGYFRPIKKLFDMNDISMPWKRIYATYPEEDNATNSRGWTREEIQRMLRFARGPMERALILVCASSGVRVGGIADLDWRDLVLIYRAPDGGLHEGDADVPEGAELACAMLRIYRDSSEAYPAFITPEAYGALQDYRTERVARFGREPGPGEPLFTKSGDTEARVTLAVIKSRITEVLTRAGLRGSGDMASPRRHRVPMTNGFRRFWNKTCKEAVSGETALASLIKKEFMMGHTGLVKLDRNYFKTHVLELAEEYLHAVPDLTIDDAERLRQSDRLKSAKIHQLEDDRDARIAELEDMVKSLAERLDR